MSSPSEAKTNSLYLENIRKLTQNETMQPLLHFLMQKNGGVMSNAYTVVIASLKTELEFVPSRWISYASLRRHFERHKDLGFKTPEDYLNAAIEFAARRNDTSFIIYNRINNRWIKYDAKTMEILILSARYKIISYYRKDQQSPEISFEKFLLDYYSDRQATE